MFSSCAELYILFSSELLAVNALRPRDKKQNRVQSQQETNRLCLCFKSRHSCIFIEYPLGLAISEITTIVVLVTFIRYCLFQMYDPLKWVTWTWVKSYYISRVICWIRNTYSISYKWPIYSFSLINIVYSTCKSYLNWFAIDFFKITYWIGNSYYNCLLIRTKVSDLLKKEYNFFMVVSQMFSCLYKKKKLLI